ncbi:MAG TPA: extracellular solute-binding protein [Gemmatimonadaceae bacterium]|nr:extracellular solute-binding protein [Gemmatimonadaceae bacterium]
MRSTAYPILTAAAAALIGACSRSPRADHPTLVVFNAGALALPLRAALDSFAPSHGYGVSQENAGSVETIRKISDLGRVPDVVAVADTALFARLIPGRLTGPIALLGSSRLVLAYTDRSRFADEVTARNWADVTTRPGVQVGRSDPTLDPAGYRALMAMQLAERYYKRPGLAAKLRAAASTANVRPKSADLVALLQTGNLDYAWEYESVARKLGLRFVNLPREVDLGDPTLATTYSVASVDISPSSESRSGGTSHVPLVMHGAPIVFGAGVPKDAPHAEAAHQFITFLMSPEGRSILVASGLQPVGVAAADTR